MSTAESLTASLEDYIEAVYNIEGRQGAARVTDIAEDLGVAKSSVTGALRGLSSRGLVNYDPYSLITLTDEGKAVAERVARRHSILARFLEEVLGLPANVAQENACRVEHAMSPEVADRLLKFVEFVENCPRGGEDFIKGFARFFAGHNDGCLCEECLAKVGRES
jgi:DtxR family Mn-dependent transcriptional regulator